LSPARRPIRPRLALGATTPNVLGHLSYHLQPQRPEELRMVTREVQLCRLVELMLRVANE
jgi:hypothetical protein